MEEGAAGRLADALCNTAAARGVQLAQVLLDPTEVSARRLFAVHGFREMAELLYLSVGVRRRAPIPQIPDSLRWVEYSPATHALFSRTIVESYEQSLDCPGLNGLREIEDVIAGHKATGDFDPRLWYVLIEKPAAAYSGMASGPRRILSTPGSADVAASPGDAGQAAEGRPLAVLLLSPISQTDAVELVYLGLPVAARGRGVGALVMKHALGVVARIGRSRLTLAVDAGNAPALALYYRHGMQRVGSKVAMMRDLRPSGEPAAPLAAAPPSRST